MKQIGIQVVYGSKQYNEDEEVYEWVPFDCRMERVQVTCEKATPENIKEALELVKAALERVAK